MISQRRLKPLELCNPARRAESARQGHSSARSASLDLVWLNSATQLSDKRSHKRSRK